MEDKVKADRLRSLLLCTASRKPAKLYLRTTGWDDSGGVVSMAPTPRFGRPTGPGVIR